MSSSDTAEEEVGIAGLVLPNTSHKLAICNFFAFNLSMEEYSKWRRAVGLKNNQFKVVVVGRLDVYTFCKR